MPAYWNPETPLAMAVFAAGFRCPSPCSVAAPGSSTAVSKSTALVADGVPLGRRRRSGGPTPLPSA